MASPNVSSYKIILQCIITMSKAAFNKSLLTSKLDLKLGKELLKC